MEVTVSDGGAAFTPSLDGFDFRFFLFPVHLALGKRAANREIPLNITSEALSPGMRSGTKVCAKAAKRAMHRTTNANEKMMLDPVVFFISVPCKLGI
jgi:hypothetical protein